MKLYSYPFTAPKGAVLADYDDALEEIEAARAEGYRQGKEGREEASTDEYWRRKREGISEERKRWWEAIQSAGVEITDGGQYRDDIES